MSNIFKLDLQGLNELMKSAEMQRHLDEAGHAVAQAAGKDFDCQTYVLNFVAVNNIFPTTKEAGHKNYEENTLLKALGAVGLKAR